MQEYPSANLLTAFSFVDCMLVGFVVQPDLRSITIRAEAYLPPVAGEPNRTKTVLTVTLHGVLRIAGQVHPELWTDLALPYDVHGADGRANELYALELYPTQQNTYHLTLNADFLTLNIQCQVAVVEPAP